MNLTSAAIVLNSFTTFEWKTVYPNDKKKSNFTYLGKRNYKLQKTDTQYLYGV